MPKIGRRDHQRRQLAVRPGRRLQRNRRQPRNLGQHLLQLVQQLKQPLDRVVRLQRVQVGDPRQSRHPLVPLAVVLHRATAQRIEVRIDRHVEGRKVREVADDFRLGHFWQGRRLVRKRLGRQQFLRRRHRDVALRQSPRAAPGLGEFEQEGRGRGVAHGKENGRYRHSFKQITWSRTEETTEVTFSIAVTI
jgi:hypothetical protein